MRNVNRSLLAAVLLAAGCASAGAPEPVLDSLSAIRSAGECAPEVEESEVPSVAAMVDTAMLAPALLQLISDAQLDTAHAVLTMEYMPDGTNARRDLIEHSLPVPVADSLQELVFQARRTLPAAEADRGARLRIDFASGGEEISYSASPREYCTPKPRNIELAESMRQYTGSGTRFRGGVRERTVIMRVTVHPAGYVAGAAVVRGAGRGSTLERDLATYLQQFAFEPATLDGIPTYGYIDIPVRVRG